MKSRQQPSEAKRGSPDASLNSSNAAGSPNNARDGALKNRKPTNGSGRHVDQNGDIYEGTFVDGLRHGSGVMVWADGRQYRGGWERDLPHGTCEEVMPDRTTYKGEYRQGLRHGQGLEVSVYGDEFNGEWVKGMKHGVGDYFSDGLHYEGEWLDDRRHGQAKCLFRNGDLYEGEFEGDLMEGIGTMLMANGCKYEGSWSKGKMDGQGRLLYPSGDIYEGEWKAGSRSGYGKYVSANGSVYEGDFKNGKRDGKGVQTTMVAGQSNYKCSLVPFRLVEGERYDGEWRKGKRSGSARVYIRGRMCYEGQFLNNERDGVGTAFFKDGTEYEGEWKEGKMHGRGRMCSASGNKVEGVWEGGACKQVLQGTLPDRVEQYSSKHGETDMMEHFERGKARLLSGNIQTGSHDDRDVASESGGESGTDRANLSSVGFLNDIDEGEEDLLGVRMKALTAPCEVSTEPAEEIESQERDRRASSSLPPVSAPAPMRERTGQMAGPQHARDAAGHDEMVEIAGRRGVPIKGTFDDDGNYIPPVSEQTYRDWNAVNHFFVQSRDDKRPSSRGASPYLFDANRQPGYGEGVTPKLAKANAPKRTDAMVAGPGEFSFKRWRAERGPF